MYKVWCDWMAILVPIHDQSLAAKYLEELRKKGVVITKVVILHHYTHLGPTHLDPYSSTWRKITEKLEPGAEVEHWGCKAGWETEWLQNLVRKSAVPITVRAWTGDTEYYALAPPRPHGTMVEVSGPGTRNLER